MGRRIMSTVTAWIVTNNEWNVLRRTVEFNAQHDWIENIVILHGDDSEPSYMNSLSKKFNKVFEYWQCFGGRGDNPKAKFEFSFVPAVEDGGWNELKHRNACLEIAEQYGSDYLLAIDTDEVFMDNTYEMIDIDADVVYFEFNTWIYKNAIKKYPVSREGLRRIHPRAWKNNGTRYRAHAQPIPNYKNQNLHVWPWMPKVKSITMSTPQDLRLQHLHHMFESKRDSNYNNYPEEKLLLVDYKWPHYIRDIFIEEQTNMNYGQKISVGI